jgi:hypothetical protein
MLELAPLGVVTVTVNGYVPGGVACPPGDFARLLHAESPTAISTSTPNESIHRGRRLKLHAAPAKDSAANMSVNVSPPPNPPGTGCHPGRPPLQYVVTTIATCVATPVSVTVLGTIRQVMSFEVLLHDSVTVPLNPPVLFSCNPNATFPPGVVVPLDDPPGAIPIVTGEFVLNVAVTLCAAFIVTVQVPVPLQPAKLHPAKVEFAPAAAVNVTIVPVA